MILEIDIEKTQLAYREDIIRKSITQFNKPKNFNIFNGLDYVINENLEIFLEIIKNKQVKKSYEELLTLTEFKYNYIIQLSGVFEFENSEINWNLQQIEELKDEIKDMENDLDFDYEGNYGDTINKMRKQINITRMKNKCDSMQEDYKKYNLTQNFETYILSVKFYSEIKITYNSKFYNYDESFYNLDLKKKFEYNKFTMDNKTILSTIKKISDNSELTVYNNEEKQLVVLLIDYYNCLLGLYFQKLLWQNYTQTLLKYNPDSLISTILINKKYKIFPKDVLNIIIKMCHDNYKHAVNDLTIKIYKKYAPNLNTNNVPGVIYPCFIEMFLYELRYFSKDKYYSKEFTHKK